MLHTTVSTKADTMNSKDVSYAESANKFYLATWRWHFYAGVYVVPFLIMLALTGLIMLYQDQLEAYQYRDRLFVTVGATQTPASVQLQAVQAAYGEATINEYIPPSRLSEREQSAGIFSEQGVKMSQIEWF